MNRLFVVLLLLCSAGLSAQTAPPVSIGGSIGITGGQSLQGQTNITMTDADYTMNPNEWWAGTLKVTSSGSLTATRNIIAPTNAGQQYIVENATAGGQAICVGEGSVSCVTIANGTAVAVFFDGTNYGRGTNDVVTLGTTQTISGLKTFSSSTVFNGPLTANSTFFSTGTANFSQSVIFNLNTAGSNSVSLGTGNHDPAPGAPAVNSLPLMVSGVFNNGTTFVNDTYTIQTVLESSTSPTPPSFLEIVHTAGTTGTHGLILDPIYFSITGNFVNAWSGNGQTAITLANGDLKTPTAIPEWDANGNLVSTGLLVPDIPTLNDPNTFAGLNTFVNGISIPTSGSTGGITDLGNGAGFQVATAATCIGSGTQFSTCAVSVPLSVNTPTTAYHPDCHAENMTGSGAVVTNIVSQTTSSFTASVMQTDPSAITGGTIACTVTWHP